MSPVKPMSDVSEAAPIACLVMMKRIKIISIHDLNNIYSLRKVLFLLHSLFCVIIGNLPLTTCTLKRIFFYYPSLVIVSITNLVLMTPEHVSLTCLQTTLLLKASFCATVSLAAPLYGPIIVPIILFPNPNLSHQLQLCSSCPVRPHKYKKKKPLPLELWTSSPLQAAGCSLSEPSLQSLGKNKLCITGVHQHPV